MKVAAELARGGGSRGGDELIAGYGEFDARGCGGREDVGVSRATVGVSLKKKEEASWWVGAPSKGRRRKLG